MHVDDLIPNTTLLIAENDRLRREALTAGMTLRDQFAMAALQGLLAKEGNTADICYEAFAECAYSYADAMLEARKK